jgi:pimeloyl-ACP methyl ester carboxylesterase
MSWVLQQAELAAVSRTCAVDLPGHGESGTDIGDGTIGFIADDIAAFLGARNSGQVHLVGHSLGGAIAVDLAHRRPDLVASLFLISPAGLGQGIDPDFLADFVSMATIEAVEVVLRRLVARPRLINRQLASRVLEHLLRPGVRESLQKVARELGSIELTLAPALMAVSQTTLPRMVVWGARDRTNPIDEVRLTAFASAVSVVDATCHLPQIESPAQVNQLMRQFYADLRHS